MVFFKHYLTNSCLQSRISSQTQYKQKGGLDPPWFWTHHMGACQYFSNYESIFSSLMLLFLNKYLHKYVYLLFFIHFGIIFIYLYLYLHINNCLFVSIFYYFFTTHNFLSVCLKLNIWWYINIVSVSLFFFCLSIYVFDPPVYFMTADRYLCN